MTYYYKKNNKNFPAFLLHVPLNSTFRSSQHRKSSSSQICPFKQSRSLSQRFPSLLFLGFSWACTIINWGIMKQMMRNVNLWLKAIIQILIVKLWQHKSEEKHLTFLSFLEHALSEIWYYLYIGIILSAKSCINQYWDKLQEEIILEKPQKIT